MAQLLSVNVGAPAPNPYKATKATGIDKRPVTGPVAVADPGRRRTSALAGDHIGDKRHHGGAEQALYAVSREDLDWWGERLDRLLPNGFFGENLTVAGIDPNRARLGERWRIGSDVEVEVTSPRVPCATFRGWMGEPGWLKTFTEAARPGAYFRVRTPGEIRAGDEITVVRRPAHDVTVALAFRAILTERDLRPKLLEVGEDLIPELRELASR